MEKVKKVPIFVSLSSTEISQGQGALMNSKNLNYF